LYLKVTIKKVTISPVNIWTHNRITPKKLQEIVSLHFSEG